MKFSELHDHVPYARYGKEKSLTMSPYKGITLAMPGRHAEDCSPKGGDFVVMVSEPRMKWKRHQFTHEDIFNDVELKVAYDPTLPTELDLFMRNYLEIVTGEDPNHMVIPVSLPGINTLTMMYALQCLAVAEHRRYSQHEAKFGGRFLPFRFAAGIAEGLWTANDAIKVQKYGRPAVEKLEKANGLPILTKQLMS